MGVRYVESKRGRVETRAGCGGVFGTAVRPVVGGPLADSVTYGVAQGNGIALAVALFSEREV